MQYDEIRIFDTLSVDEIYNSLRRCKCWLMWADEESRTYYIEAGSASGITFLLQFVAEDGAYGCGAWYAGTGLNPNRVVRIEELPYQGASSKVSTILKWVADRCGDLGEILPIEKVPAFSRKNGDELAHHRDGWFSRSERGVQIWHLPEFFEVETYQIREGVYCYFPNGEIRLARRKEFFAWPGWTPSLWECWRPKQLGELFAWESLDDSEWQSLWQSLVGQSGFLLIEGGGHQPDGIVGTLDGHGVKRDAQGLRVEHPAHGTLQLDREASYIIGILPGTSRPFSRD